MANSWRSLFFSSLFSLWIILRFVRRYLLNEWDRRLLEIASYYNLVLTNFLGDDISILHLACTKPNPSLRNAFKPRTISESGFNITISWLWTFKWSWKKYYLAQEHSGQIKPWLLKGSRYLQNTSRQTIGGKLLPLLKLEEYAVMLTTKINLSMTETAKCIIGMQVGSKKKPWVSE